MKEKTSYSPPEVLERIAIEMESAILGGSVVDNMGTVSTSGQSVEEFDLSSGGFNSSWEE